MNLKVFVYFLLLGTLFIACKDEAAAIKGKDLSKEIIAVKDLPKLNACDLISKEFLVKNIKADEFSYYSRTGADTETANGCFFQWTSATKPNAGMMLQVMKNPFEAETPVWATEYINGMKQGNAGSAEGVENFKAFTAAGDDGVYNERLGQYYWRIGNNYVFMLAFNLDESAEEKLGYAEKIAKESMKNFNAKLSEMSK
ncbi:MAG: hypothetical protein KDC49_09135 [Saprospiraceae bacterium]|nr:hypothetical protein [Saprospiraceae bacterium]